MHGIDSDWHKRNDEEDIQAKLTQRARNNSPNNMQMETAGESNKKDMTYF